MYYACPEPESLSAGIDGMISFAHAGFYGVGAYTAALLAVNYQVSFLLALPIAMLLCELLVLIVSAIALRTINDYFVICTLGIQVVVFPLADCCQSETLVYLTKWYLTFSRRNGIILSKEAPAMPKKQNGTF